MSSMALLQPKVAVFSPLHAPPHKNQKISLPAVQLAQLPLLHRTLISSRLHSAQTSTWRRSKVHSPNKSSSRQGQLCTRCQAADVKGVQQGGIMKGPALVWFKHDLRVHDHPGLAEVKQAEAVVPVFVVDVKTLAALPSEVVEAIHEGVVDLRRSLRGLGSDLVVRSGSAEALLPQLLAEVGAVRLVTEVEVESIWKRLADSVRGALQQGSDGSRPKMQQWHVALHTFSDLQCPPTSYKQYSKLKSPPLDPLPAPRALPPLPASVDVGDIPSLANLTAEIRSYWGSSGQKLGGYEDQEKVELDAPIPPGALAAERFAIRGGEAGALNGLKGYLRFQEATGREDWYVLYEEVRALEQRPMTSFPALFASALAAGCLSRRRVFHDAIEYEKARNGGRLSPFGFGAITAKAAARAAEISDFHHQVAQQDVEQEADTDNGNGAAEKAHASQYWRWKGFLTQYIEAGTAGPAVLLVHGFGAFSQHFRRNVGLLGRDCRVWAVTLPGFGRSEKPARPYSQDLWNDFLRDFICQVIKEPAAIAGNSIGGFVSASVAADHPSLVTSLTLLNSAGRILPNYTPPAPYKVGGRVVTPSASEGGGGPFGDLPRPLGWAFSRLLFAYLDGNVEKILTRCYPKNPGAVDEFLIEEIKRAAADPGAVDVFESVFYLPKPRPLNYLVDKFPGPVLVIQGRYDPLNDAVARANDLKAACPKVEVQFVEAGHCPHDEVPEDVSARLGAFVKAPTFAEADTRLSELPQQEAGSAADVVAELVEQATAKKGP